MLRLTCTYGRFVTILGAQGFAPHPAGDAGGFRLFRATSDGTVRLVSVPDAPETDAIPAGVLRSMIRQAGLARIGPALMA